MSRVRGEIQEIQVCLKSTNYYVKLDGMKRLITQMTAGKDFSVIFQDVIRCLEHSEIELKKLVYLYIIHYSRKRPDDAIMVVNNFRKDIYQGSPLVKALALRSIGCLRVKQLNEYLFEPIKESLKNEDPYVRKSAILCIAKIYQVNPELIEQRGIFDILKQGLISESNPNVMATIFYSLMDISQLKGECLIQINPQITRQLMVALNDCNEWCQIFILDSLVTYQPQDSAEAEQLCDRICVRLQHINPAVVVSAFKVLVNLLSFVQQGSQEILQKMTQPLGKNIRLASLINSDKTEIQFIILRNIKVIYQKYPNLISKHLKLFFCTFNETLYNKLEKIEILVLLANQQNSDKILAEFQDYIQDIDQEFVLKVIWGFQSLSLKLPKTCEAVIEILLNFYQNVKDKSDIFVNEIIIAFHHLYRQNHSCINHLDSLNQIKESLIKLTSAKAKQCGIWIIGEFLTYNPQFLKYYTQNFSQEQRSTQLQILTASVKLFLFDPAQHSSFILSLLQETTETCFSPDVRDRAYMYWRLLSTNPALAQEILNYEKKSIFQIQEIKFLDEVLQELGMSSSLEQKPAAFIYNKKTIKFQSAIVAQKIRTLDLLDEVDNQSLLNTVYEGINCNLKGGLSDQNGEIFLKIQYSGSIKTNLQIENNYFDLQLENQKVELCQGDFEVRVLSMKSQNIMQSLNYPFSLIFLIQNSVESARFQLLCDLKLLMKPDGLINQQTYKETFKSIPDSIEIFQDLYIKNQFIEDNLKKNNIFLVAKRFNKEKQRVEYYSAKTVNGIIALIEFTIKSDTLATVAIKSFDKSVSLFIFQSFQIIL